jgi:cobalamin biosynthesis Mg chelatase CobN
MTRAVVFLTATLLSASLGTVAQNSSNPGGSGSSSAQATASAQSAQPIAPSRVAAPVRAATGPSKKGIESSAQNGSRQDKDKQDAHTSSAELPQTSTILPLLGLLGLGSLVAGLFARR